MQQTGEKVNNNLNDRSQYHKPHKPKKHPKLFRRLITAFSNDHRSGNQHFKPATDMIRMHINRDRHTKKFNRPRCKCCNTARLTQLSTTGHSFQPDYFKFWTNVSRLYSLSYCRESHSSSIAPSTDSALRPAVDDEARPSV